MAEGVELRLPFTGRWLVRNSPARRVPSHGTNLLGTRYAIDFVAVGSGRATGTRRDWRTVLATEPPERFVAFGLPILAPCDGVVVAVHDGEADHAARRSQPALLTYALGQAARLRAGVDSVAGNRVVVERDDGVFVALVHLKTGSLRVATGDRVTVGEQLAECGNSGNSTQPHVHVQATHGADFATARGLPIAFTTFREWPRRGAPVETTSGLPAEASVVEPLPEPWNSR